MSNKIGVQFEKYVQLLLKINGVETERNIMYHKVRKGEELTRQVDLEYRAGKWFPKWKILECKYVSGSSNFLRNYIQITETVMFTGADDGILVTNKKIARKEEKESEWGIKIYDQEVLLALRRTKGDIGEQVARIESEIRRMPYTAEDNKFVHKYLKL